MYSIHMTHETPLEPELGPNQYVDQHGNVQKENITENLENIDRENPFNL